MAPRNAWWAGVFLLAALVASACVTHVAGGVLYNVVTCKDLREALDAADPPDGTSLVALSNTVNCSAADWPGPARILKHVELVGSKKRHSRADANPTIFFNDIGLVFDIASNASLRLESIVLKKYSLDGSGNLSKLGFVTGDPGSRFAMAGVVITYSRCPPSEAPPATTPTHARIARVRHEDAGTNGARRAQPSRPVPLTVIKEVVKNVGGLEVHECESLVTCGLVNRTVLETVGRILSIDASGLCNFRSEPEPVSPPVPQSVSGGVGPPVGSLANGTSSRGLGQQAPAPAKASGVHKAVWAGIGAVVACLGFLAVVLFMYRRKQLKRGPGNKSITTTMIDSDSNDNSGSPALGAIHVAPPSNPFDQIPNKMMAKARKPPPYGGGGAGGGPNVSGLLSSWDMPEMGNIRVIRELPMSEAAPSEYNPDVAGADAPVKLQLAGLDVQLRRLLGNGTHTSVYEGAYKHMECAMKIIEHNSEMLEMHGEAMEDYLTKDLVHPNVVKLCAARTCEPDVVRKWITSLQSPAGPSTSTRTPDPLALNLFNSALLPRVDVDEGTEDLLNTFVVMEYCNGGTLAQALLQGDFFTIGKKPNMPIILMRAIDIAHAMEHLHAHCVIHGDLKPENVLLHRTHSDSSGFICKVVDFGLRPKIPPHMLLESMSLMTMAHLPPELLSTGSISVATDVYSFGMILWGLVSGASPFSTLKRSELIRHVVAGDRPGVPQSAPMKYARLIEDCWHQEPGKRPDFRTITDRLRAIMFDLENTGPPTQQSRRTMSAASSGTLDGTAAKGFETSDYEDSPRSVDSVEDSYRAAGAHGNPRQLQFAPGRFRQSGAAREAARGVSRDSMAAAAPPKRVYEASPRLSALSIASSTGNWAYDGDEERDSYCPTVDSLSTLTHGVSLRPGTTAFTFGDEREGAGSNGLLSTGSTKDGATGGTVPGIGLDGVIPHGHNGESICQEPQHEADVRALPPEISHTQWSNSDAVTDDDTYRPSMDVARRPQFPEGYHSSSD
eukprot:evm.model.scf_1010.7 EVM.evm.TU.scf_1010.7   scf_1010:41586-46371(+)